MTILSPDEYPSDVADYIERVRGRDPRALLGAQPGFLERAIDGLDEAAQLHRYEPGKWSVREVIGHVVDTERVFSYRLLRFARGDSSPLPGFDHDLYVSTAQFDDRELDELARDFRAVRAATLSLVSTIPDDAWALAGTASGNRVTARALLSIIAGHAAYHFELLADRYGLESFRE